jgi:excisionase family DNA binding protein
MNSKLLRAQDVAERLNISKSQAFSLMKEGEIPTVRFGRCVRVRPEDLEIFITKNISMNPDTILKTKLAVDAASLGTN